MADSSNYDATPVSPRDRDRDRPAMGHHPAGASSNAGTTGGLASSAGGGAGIEDRSRSPGAPPLRPDVGGNGLPLQAPPRQHHYQSHGHHQGGAGQGGSGGHVIPANPDHLTLRALVTTKEAGVVIGKQGANIKSIREDSNARINISEHVQGVHERILSITGAIEEVAKAYAQVSRNLNAGDLRTATPDAVEATPLTIRFLIPNSRMGSVIGKGGARIKEIQDESNARLAAQPTPLPNSHDRILEMIGVPDAIHIATYHMLVTIKEHSDRPMNDRPYRPEYGVGGNGAGGQHGGGGGGGYHQQQQMQGGGGGHHQGGGYGGGNQGGGGSSYYAPTGQQGQGGQYYTPQQSHYGGGQGQGQGGGAPYNNQGQQQYQQPQIANGPTDTRTFYCPANKVGSMIGRGGQKINRIRTESGCRINVEDARGERGDRPFVVTGPAHAVERAIATLEQALRRELKRDEEVLKAGGSVGGAAPM